MIVVVVADFVVVVGFGFVVVDFVVVDFVDLCFVVFTITIRLCFHSFQLIIESFHSTQ